MNNPFQTAPLQVSPTPETFDESAYLAVNPDVAEAVRLGKIASGWIHFKKFGRIEGRRQKAADEEFVLPAIRARKLAALKLALLEPQRPLTASGKYCFLDDSARPAQDLMDDMPISENGYDDETIGLIESCADGLILDVGAGYRPVYYSNVVNFEMMDYPTTDVIGVADRLPFKDDSFEGVISIAVLEHVKDPFRCAAEIARVIKPGGWLKCCAPFLQPLHGYPHHYFNMTHEGLRTLFEPHLTIERQEVTGPTHPIWAIAWQLRSWSQGLSPRARKQFLRTRVEDLIAFPGPLLEKPWARELPREKLFELAAATILYARKPASNHASSLAP